MSPHNFEIVYQLVLSYVEKGYSLAEALLKLKIPMLEFYRLCHEIRLSELQHIDATHSLRPSKRIEELAALSGLDNAIIKIPFGDDLDYAGWL
jgi:hypothetical protein